LDSSAGPASLDVDDSIGMDPLIDFSPSVGEGLDAGRSGHRQSAAGRAPRAAGREQDDPQKDNETGVNGQEMMTTSRPEAYIPMPGRVHVKAFYS